ncbi:MAG: tRNA (guanosine(46)-N7)-methyltransferase TrmB [Candidatus Cloacimonetes bacterium]|jgi:tRNA (guanine-N7-)-methyltransferase|nr:tRNA (guanosine(46)-N7)-methyltransferase TrmB [Candidatus Cloacimonadota bacterium]MCB5287224.1 tRNA (guanosine(46)-N7)-methyltransferase TrmB [Candidatus Cloacimonadota bacterium]MCK9184542.1 tRNA (guanosine(46)-N7)-methyltransferase TrmB [Candidatus Cloacimonadota bacterium]MCK9584394.1 tRNA (guanosine(46)-N7)-methyltransferase TrmB [Candidatus Cloacimonadota bacterium]MDY0229545.1 tRNA (guanosine(46)-N7)-methyltransferase TrmB [Candidatus Cloacimonadaceae bacterium]
MIADRDYFLIELAAGKKANDSFADGQDLYLEIGSGKGEFISRYPISHLTWNFIGMEMNEKRIRVCLKKLSVESNPNVRLLRARADAGIAEYFRPESLSGVFIQHPDPWPKRRHHRRRLFQEDFLTALAGIMKPAAQVQISTDHADYAAWIVNEFSKSPHFLCLQDDPIQGHANLDEHVVTWFEQEQRRLGYPPNFMLYKRI